jgi:transcriptional regulator of acetoin/glycerol metabolism
VATPAALLHATRKGVNLSERCVGTTAPAISLAEGLPYLVGRGAHYFDNVRPFFCVAAPIDDPSGQRLGALDITAYDNVPAFDIMTLVVDAAAAIENSLFSATPERLLVHFHPRAELVGTPMEGLLQVDVEGIVTGVNRVAARLLCTPRAALLGRRFGELFDRRLQPLFGRMDRQRGDLVEMQSQVGLQVMASFEGVASRAAPLSRGLAEVASAEPPDCADDGPPREAPASMRELECRAIERTLAALDGNVSAAARQLGISRNTIYRRRKGLA